MIYAYLGIKIALEYTFDIKTQPNTKICTTGDGLAPIPNYDSYPIPMGSIGSMEDKG